jgi:hypothetical protein
VFSVRIILSDTLRIHGSDISLLPGSSFYTIHGVVAFLCSCCKWTHLDMTGINRQSSSKLLIKASSKDFHKPFVTPRNVSAQYPKDGADENHG